MTPWNYLAPYILWSEYLKKAACIFAGLGHLQPLLLATTNANYLLDRFCMERCCSSDYISRIVTSIIFMEILSIIVVRIVLYGALRDHSAESQAQQLVVHTRKEEKDRDIISTLILFLISLGYIQILYAFTTGGKKGHMHWFYSSLLIQHFLNSLIAGSIGFWEVGRALWYLVTLPLGPVVVFFYQLMIHSWIRNNGPRNVEYLVVENQIVLATAISCIATIFWTAGYLIPHIPYKQPATLNLTTPTNSSEITVHPSKPAELKIYTITGSGTTEKSLTIQSTANTGTATVKVHSITVNLRDAKPNTVFVYPRIIAEVKTESTAQDGQPVKAKIEAKYEDSNETGTVTITAQYEIKKDEKTVPSGPKVTLGTQTVTGDNVQIQSLHLALEPNNTITVQGAGTSVPASNAIVKGYTYYPNPSYYISQTSAGDKLWNEKWDGGRCFYAEYYEKTGGNTHALLKLCILGNTLKMKYYGTTDGTNWKIITTEAKFSECVDLLQRTGTFNIAGSDGEDAEDPNHNTYFTKVLCNGWSWQYIFTWAFNSPTPTWAPLVMQGLSVGAVGSIFPNLIPKTLVCPKTTRTLSVMNMFLVTLPHIFNVMLGDMDLLEWIGVGDDWTGPGIGWPCSLLLYTFYILAILFAIFNIHYPEWALSTFLRNNTLMVFLMILFTDVLNESFNAISRAGICSQKAAGGTKKNHPCLHNKIACLMNLTYIPFWLTTTPMMKSYVSSLDPFLCDKDRDHWPTARYGRMKSFGYWCKCACRGLYNSPRKLVTLNMRKALTRKDPKMYFLVTHDIPPED